MSKPKSIGEILTDYFLNSQEPFAVAFRNHFANANQQKNEGQTFVNTNCINSSLSVNPKEWLDNQDVMQMLHISPRTLQTLRSNGTLPFSRINGKFYYKVSDLEALLESNYSANAKKPNGYGN